MNGSSAGDAVWLRRALGGGELVREGDQAVVGVLEPAHHSDTIFRHYLEPASRWTSVTPIILPGHDDPAHLRRKADRERESTGRRRQLLERVLARTEGLIRKALRHAGIAEVLAVNARIEWQTTGFLPGVDAARAYGAPDHLKRFPRVHVRIDFRDAKGNPVFVRGPLCVGAGRFYGLGLLVAVNPPRTAND